MALDEEGCKNGGVLMKKQDVMVLGGRFGDAMEEEEDGLG